MKKIAHAVDEHHLRRRPAQWLGKFLRHQAKVEALLIRMARHATESLGKDFGVAMSASRTDLRAASHRIPGGVGPFNGGIGTHVIWYRRFFLQPPLDNRAIPSGACREEWRRHDHRNGRPRRKRRSCHTSFLPRPPP